MTKYHFLFQSVEKEEQWIEKILDKGYWLVRAKPLFGQYQFEKRPEKAPRVRLDYRVFETKAQFLDYQTLFMDCGWRHLGGDWQSGIQVFAQASPAAGEALFSDPSSKAAVYARMGRHWLTTSITMFPILVVMQTTGMLDVSRMWNLKAQYLTPGLWETQGFTFWRLFLFETPFALGRAYLGLLLLLVLLLSLGFSLWAFARYYRAKQRAKQK